MEFAAKNGIVTLAQSRPLNDPNMKGGTNVWEVDVIVTQSGDALEWRTRLHGSNGMTAEDSGTQAGQLKDVHVDLSADALVSLPAKVPLCHIGRQSIEWHVDR